MLTAGQVVPTALLDRPPPSLPTWTLLGASWLSDRLLCLAGRSEFGNAVPSEALLADGEQAHILPTSVATFPRCSDDGEPGHMLLVKLPEPARIDVLPPLLFRSNDRAVVYDARGAGPALSDLATLLLRSEVTASAPDVRAELLRFFVTVSLVRSDSPFDERIHTNLHMAREVLRDRLPRVALARAEPLGLHVEALLATDARTFYLKGWLHDLGRRTTRLTAVSPEGSRVELLDRLFRYSRADVDDFYATADLRPSQPGIICAFNTPEPSRLADGWLIELEDRTGAQMEVSVPSVVADIDEVRRRLLGDVVVERLPADELRRHHIRPALTSLEERLDQSTEVKSIDQWGVAPSDPHASIVVPLYRRIDFMEHQLAQFAHDPEIAQSDLIYVLDSPELADWFRDSAMRLHRLYRIPFRAVVLNRNAGFSGANNAAAALATGRLLVLLNSDVLPDQPGWLGIMARFYDTTPGIGTLGPMLVYEDETIQHAGMDFFRPAGEHLWANRHPFKGMHRSLPAANVSRAVSAVTGACLMIDRNLYQELGGLHSMYVQGDCEDSDLCLRLHEMGRQNWYTAETSLYHLEAQSYSGDTRLINDTYNAWLQTYLWNDRITHLMSKEGHPPLETAVARSTL